MTSLTTKILLFFNIIFIVLTLFFSRWIFFYKYEPEYYENYYYHSQWNIPESTRGISDGELYKFVGYRLAWGENPFNINYEVPPFAKLIYGLAARFLGNPYWATLIFYFLSLFVLYQFSLLLFPKKLNLRLLTLLLFTSSPFIATQLTETMLDLPLTLFFLSYLYFFSLFLKTKSVKHIIIAGFFLGLATGSKIGVYTPLITFFALYILFTNKSTLKTYIFYLFSIASGYIFSFITYFIKHPNPIPWIRLHEKPIKFYMGTQGSATFDKLVQLKGVFLNQYQGFWVNASPTTLGDWSPLLPIGTILVLLLLFLSFKQKKLIYLYLSLFSLSILFINSFIPFYPRYLMPLLPIFCLLTVYFFQHKPGIIFFIVILNIPFFYQSVCVNQLNGNIESTARFFNTRNYRELYRNINPSQRQQISEQFFINTLENFYTQIDTRKINYQLTLPTTNYQTTITTGYGIITHNGQFTYHKIHNQWKLDWSWDYLYPGYTPDKQLIITPKDKILKREVLAIPRTLTNWGENLTVLQDLTGIKQQQINERLRFSIPDKYPRWIGDIDNKTIIKEFPFGLEIRKFYPNSTIYFDTDKQNRIYLIK